LTHVREWQQFRGGAAGVPAAAAVVDVPAADGEAVMHGRVCPCRNCKGSGAESALWLLPAAAVVAVVLAAVAWAAHVLPVVWHAAEPVLAAMFVPVFVFGGVALCRTLARSRQSPGAAGSPRVPGPGARSQDRAR
jgi:hypothetical protein